jgi:salicylate hydroxylase
MATQKDFIVAGGGLGGLAVALALARRGRKVRVLEKASEFGEIGYGIQMGPNIMRVLDHLGVMRDLESTAFFPDALVMMDAVSGEEVTRIALGDAFQKRYGARYFVIHRRDLHGGLLAACERHEGVTLQASKGLASFEDRGGEVVVRCEDGSEYVGAALVGADGLWSPTRKAIVNDAPRPTGHTVYRGVVPIDEVTDRQFMNSMVIWCGHDIHLVQYRLRGGTVMNNVAVFVSPRFRRGEKEFGQPEELFQMFEQAVPRVRDMLKYVSTERNWILHDRDPATNWTKGRATLLGDAAHPTLQYLAQGACMAMEDGVVLAAQVAQHGDDVNEAFLAYQRRRMNRTARVVLTARFFGEVCHAGGGARMLRNEIASRRDIDFPYEIDWLYRGIDIEA